MQLLPGPNHWNQALAVADSPRCPQWGCVPDQHLHRRGLVKFKVGIAKTCKAMETAHAIRFTNTGGKDEKFDRDNVGLVPWRGALYSAGPDVCARLHLLMLVTKRKVECGHLLIHLELQVIGLDKECPYGPLPEGWTYKPVASLPSPFAAAPPRSYRHIVMHVELTEIVSNTTKQTAQRRCLDSKKTARSLDSKKAWSKNSLCSNKRQAIGHSDLRWHL